MKDLKDIEELRQIVKTESEQMKADIQPIEDIAPPVVEKSITEKASDVIVVMGADKASKNEAFIDKVADSFSKGVINEQEANRLKKENLLAEQYYEKWKDVLKLAHISQPQGLGLMKTVVVVMIVPYFIMRLFGFVFMVVSETFEFFNTIFNSVFGEVKQIQYDEKGKKVAQRTGYNIFAKLFLGFLVITALVALLLLTIKAFTGFDAFLWFREIFGNK